ncbi:MAG: YafY family protein, partial [Chloroflexi bacterium]|nr:YafY family protein [Chloroflexota bacterium]
MRSDRLLSILLHLQVNRRVKARELAERFEISERTVIRDLEALSMAGVPIYAVRGHGGGWELLEEYRTNLTGLNPTEVQALFMQTPARLLRDLGLNQASETAFTKLLAALPTIQRQQAEYIRQRIHVDGAGWHESEEKVPAFPAIQQAVWQERKVQLRYQRSDNVAVERIVDPLGLVAKGRVWYLVAAIDGELRTYRVSRVQSACVMDQPCVRPENFDLAAYWAQSMVDFKQTLPNYAVTVRAAPEVIARLHNPGRFARIIHRDPPDADGWSKLEMQLDV